METFGIVSEFYVARNVVDGVSAGRILGTVNAFGFERTEERFGHGVVVAAAGPPDGLPDVESVQRLGELRRCVVAVHGPADDGFGVTVEYRGEVDPAFPGGNVGDVADHFHARCLGGEVAGEQVGDRPGGRVGLGEAVPPRLRLAGDQAQLTHQTSGQLDGAVHALAGQLGVDTPVAVGLVGIVEDIDDEFFEPLQSLRGRRFGSAAPLVVSRRRNREPTAHVRHAVLAFSVRVEGVFLRVDKLKLGAYRYSLAKKAAAFPGNSFSDRSSRTSFSSSRRRARSEIVNGGSSPAWFLRQGPGVVPYCPVLR